MAIILSANTDLAFNARLRDALRAHRYDVLTAQTGEEALRLLEAQRPSVAVLDLALLEVPGLELLAKIRAYASKLPVVIIAGEVALDTENRVREMGVTDVLRKGLKFNNVIRVINRILSQADGSRGQSISPPGASGRGAEKFATVLVVDDEAAICELIGRSLARHGYCVKAALSGEAALAMIVEEPPDVVVLDMHLLDMTGVDVLRRLNAIRCPASVLVLTGSQDEPLLKTALNLGAFDVLSKPVDLSQVELTILFQTMLTNKD